VIERAYVTAEQLGLQLWCEDEGGPYQSIPQPGSSWQPEGQPARRPHEYLRGAITKLLTLVRPETGEVRAQAVEHTTNAILHPWLKGELEALLKQCPPAPEVVPEGRRWQDWDIYPEASQLDRFFPPVRVLLILDNLAGHKSYSLVQWCAEHGILLLYTPTAGSWLNMAESLQRIVCGRALSGQHPQSQEDPWPEQLVTRFSVASCEMTMVPTVSASEPSFVQRTSPSRRSARFLTAYL